MAVLAGPLAQQISRVLRLRPGEHITLLDDSGWAYEAELVSVAPARATARLVGRTQPQTEPRVRLMLYQALAREQKLDWVLQKGTELGISVFAPVTTERSVVGARAYAGRAKLERWQRIVIEAAEQSGRARLPQVMPIRSFHETCEPPPPGVLALIASVSAEARPLGPALRSAGIGDQHAQPLREIRLYIGPEGDFTFDEVALARQTGIVPVSLGPRILRTETAGLVTFSAILYGLGEFG